MQERVRIVAMKPVAGRAAGRTSVDSVDHAKAIGIVLVVVGHSPGVPVLAHQLIFSFHVPLFYFLSGFLLARRKLALSASTYSYEVLRRLLLPYALFFAVAYGYWLATCSIGARAAKFADVAWYEPLRGFADGLGSDLFVCPPLWFFPSLIVTSLAFHALRRRLSSTVAGMLCLGAGFINAVAAHALPWRLPWGLDTLGVTLGFYAAGHCLRELSDSEQVRLGNRGRAVLAMLFAGLWIAGTLANDPVDINQRDFGSHPLLMIPVALCGSAALLLGSGFLPRNDLSRWLSRHTLLIFPLHPLVFNLISGVRELAFGLPDAATHDPWMPVVYTVAAMLVIAVVVRTMDLVPGIVAARERPGGANQPRRT